MCRQEEKSKDYEIMAPRNVQAHTQSQHHYCLNIRWKKTVAINLLMWMRGNQDASITTQRKGYYCLMRDRENIYQMIYLSWEKYISLINLYLVVNEHVNKHTCKSNRIKTDHAVNISLKMKYMYFIKIFIMYQCLYVKTLNRKKRV